MSLTQTPAFAGDMVTNVHAEALTAAARLHLAGWRCWARAQRARYVHDMTVAVS